LNQMETKKKISILHFMWSANFGGLEKQVIDLCKAQNKTNELQAGILIGSKKGSFVEELSRLKIPHWFAGMTKGFEMNINAYRHSAKIMSGFDFIHIHTYNPLILLAAIRSGKKIVYTIHGNFQLGRNPGLNDKLNDFGRKYFLNKSADLVVFNSEWSKRMAEERFGLKGKPTVVIYNGIERVTEPGIISNDTHKILIKDKFVVGTTCRFNKFKRLDRLIDAFAIFCKDKADAILLLVGDGVEKPNLEKRVAEKKLDANTIFAGYQRDVRSYQNAMDVCVFPSQQEPFGLVAVETLSLGKPTLFFKDGGGMLEIAGKEIPEDVSATVEELAGRLNYYYINRDKPQLLSKRKEIALKFSIEKMESEYRQQYEAILQQPVFT
jgi:glycosyltransferase involved in cell wall biosynthesis